MSRALAQSLSGSTRRIGSRDGLSGPMPWAIGIMLFITLLAAAAGLSVRGAASSVDHRLAGQVTVQIVEANPDSRDEQLAAALAILDEQSLVAERTAVPADEVRRLLAPWLGGEDLEDAVPLPALIDVTLRGAADDAALQGLREAIAAAAPSARVDANAVWLRPVLDLLASLQWLALTMVVLLATATAAAVVLATRGALNTHDETIKIIHLLGGTDDQISRLFQRRIAIDASIGAVIGVVAGALVIALIAFQVDAIGSGLISTGALAWYDWTVLALMPLACIALALVTARWTVLRALRKIL